MNLPVFIGSAVIMLIIVIWTMVAPESALDIIGTLSAWTIGNFGWFYVALAAAALVFLIYLALSRYGQIKLGPKYSKPQYSTFAWAAMLFAAGINIDLMFFAVAGPVSQYISPPAAEGGTDAAAREASVWTIFHYGINGWALYALMGLALSYLTYRRNLPLAVRSLLYPIVGKRVKGVVGHSVDIAAILGTIFGVAASLGIGVVQLNFGLQAIFGVPEHIAVQIGLLGFGLLIATISAVSGVDKGIKWLSQLNVVLAALLAVFVLFAGETMYLLNAMVLNIGDYFTSLGSRSTETFAFNPQTEWMGDWTLFFWAWWIAYAAFIGLFLARISRGRTIRQFVGGVLILPFSYIVMWISIYGNAAIGLIRGGNTDFGEIAANFPEQGFYTLLAEYPAFTLVALIATITGVLFFVTTADSGALVMAQLSSHSKDSRDLPRSGLRIFWGVAMALLTAAMMISGGIAVMQSATIIIALPFSFVLIVVMLGLLKSLRREFVTDRGGNPREPRRQGGRARSRRGAGVFPGDESAEDYLDAVAMPAIEELAIELRDRGFEASTQNGHREDAVKTVELTIMASDPQESMLRISLSPRPVAEGVRAAEVLSIYVDGVRQAKVVQDLAYAQLIDYIFDEFVGWSESLGINEEALHTGIAAPEDIGGGYAVDLAAAGEPEPSI
ncbi:choline BCCT transporter BetT [Paeniglutamicibacter cryotolerans]